MLAGKSSFQLNLSTLLRRARQLPVELDGISVNLPFVTVSVKPDDIERRVAREVVIRLANRRVLNARECCDSCIERALESLQEIRSLLVDKQVELAERSDGTLYLLLEVMLEGIRQFLTYVERLERSSYDGRQGYLAALEVLRGHLYRSLTQVATIASMDVPGVPEHMRYSIFWEIEQYTPPELPGLPSE